MLTIERRKSSNQWPHNSHSKTRKIKELIKVTNRKETQIITIRAKSFKQYTQLSSTFYFISLLSFALLWLCIFNPWCKGLTHCKRPWCWERLQAGGEEADRGWDGWMASPAQWTWVWASSGSWWWTGRPGVLQSMGSQSVGHDSNWAELISRSSVLCCAQSLSRVRLFATSWTVA